MFVFRAKNLILEEIRKYDSVLDLGCGKGSFLKKFKGKKVGVEIFKPYMKESVSKKTHNYYIIGNVCDVEFKSKAFDVVVAAQVLEHMNNEEGLKLFEKMKRWAKEKVIISLPNGFSGQDRADNNVFQEHVSGWDYEKLKSLGLRVYGTGGLKILRKYSDIKILITITQIISSILPRYSNNLVGVYDIKND